MSPAGPLLLDHVSLAAPAGRLEELGFTVTPTPRAAGRHARVLLEGGYLELRPGAVLEATGWFARPATPGVRRWHAAAAAAGLPVLEPEPYRGADGLWLDVGLAGADAALPVVTERSEPAGAWPPPASEHANGALRIAWIEVEAEDAAGLAALLGELGLEKGAVRVLPARGGPGGIREVVLRTRAGTLGLLGAEGRGHPIH